MGEEKSVSERLWAIAIWTLVIFFIVNFVAMIATVVINSFGTRWFNAWLPAAFTTRWYKSAWDEFQLHDVLIVTFEVVGAVVLISGLLGVPAAYALARRNFPGKQIVILLFFADVIPPITFGIPLATALTSASRRQHVGSYPRQVWCHCALRGLGYDLVHRTDQSRV